MLLMLLILLFEADVLYCCWIQVSTDNGNGMQWKFKPVLMLGLLDANATDANNLEKIGLAVRASKTIKS